MAEVDKLLVAVEMDAKGVITDTEILDSKDNVYYSPRGAVKVQVGKPRFFNKL